MCHPNCFLSDDHRTVSTCLSALPYQARSQRHYSFVGTCGTDFLRGKVYWEVRIRLEFSVAPWYIPPAARNFGLFATMGVASQNFLTNPESDSIHAAVLTLSTDGNIINVLLKRGYTLYEDFLTGLGELNGKIGFLLDSSQEQLTIIDCSSNRTLTVVSTKQLIDVRPLLCFPTPISQDVATVSMTIESGNSLEATF